MKHSLANIEKVGLPQCLTGPVSRGDAGTVAKHLKALRGRAPGTEAAYRVLGQVTLTVAEAKGQLDKDKIEAIARLLADVEAEK